MMTQQEFCQALAGINYSEKESAGENVFVTKILPQIRQISIDLVNCVRDRLSETGRGFEWLGLDLMVTAESLEVKLLEVNTSPDISHSTPVTSRLVTAAVDDLFTFLFSEKEDHPGARFLSSSGEFSSGQCCQICQQRLRGQAPLEAAGNPHWCAWFQDDRTFSSLQTTAMKRKKLKFRSSKQIYSHLTRVCIKSFVHY